MLDTLTSLGYQVQVITVTLFMYSEKIIVLKLQIRDL